MPLLRQGGIYTIPALDFFTARRSGKDREEKLKTSASSSDRAESSEQESEISSSESQPPGRGPNAEVTPSSAPSPVVQANGKSADLIIDNICKSFGDVHVLKNVSFAVRHGEFVTLLGPSGCGKTTLLRIFAGLELADSGSVTLLGAPMLEKAAHRRPVNTVFQNYALFPHLNVFENVAFGLRARKVANPEVTQRVMAALDMLQLEDFPKRYPHQLSGGQKQRVALARALVNEPELLLLDEPMSALDAKLRTEVQLDLRRLQRKLGKTFILVTHDQDEAMTVSDRIMVMNNGRIEQAGTPAEVYEHPVSRFVAQFLGSANLFAAERLADDLVRTELGDLKVRRRPEWQTGTVAIRPERIGVRNDRPAVNAFEVQIREVIYRGDHFEVFAEPGGIRIRVAPSQPLEVGQNAWLELSPDHLEVLVD